MTDNKPIYNIDPHYTNDHFKTARTVWIEQGVKVDNSGTVKGAEYNYSDRIWQWDHNKAVASRKAIDESININSSMFFEQWLRNYFDNPKLELVHILAGFNWGNGYPYQVFGYITHND